MTGADSWRSSWVARVGAVAQAVDTAGNVIEASTVVDVDPTANEFEPLTSDQVFGRGGDTLIDQEAEFQTPLDIELMLVNVI